MKISACYIVKNEEKVFRKSLQSICECADELIVVDTGSTDRTVEIAQDFHAQIYYRKWRNDFAWARNQAIEMATGDWIVFLDADEYFTDETRREIRQVIAENKDVDVLCISMDNIEIDGSVKAMFSPPRIFKNKKELRYSGAIHETLFYAGNELNLDQVMFIPAARLKLIHTGYISTLTVVKAARNLPMLLKELEKSDKPETLYPYLAECYTALGDFDNVKYYAELDIRKGRSSNNYASKSWRLLLELANKEQNYEYREKIALSAVANFSEIPEFHAELAECYAFNGRYKEAIEEGEEAIRCYNCYDSIEPMKFTSSMLKQLRKRMHKWAMILLKGETYTSNIYSLLYESKRDIVKNFTYMMRILVKEHGKNGGFGLIDNCLDDMLPENIVCVIKKWKDKQKIYSDEYETYITILSYIIGDGADEQIENFLKLIEDTTDSHLWGIAELLYKNEKYNLAWHIYSKFSLESSMINQEFWLKAGICQYEMGNYQIAEECFDNASAFGLENGELDAYKYWNERKMNNYA